jgi:hypothetical protein
MASGRKVASMTISVSEAGILTGILATLFSLVVWVFRASLTPFKIVIQNNTEVMKRIIEELDKHRGLIGDHSERLVRIETKHSERHPNEGVK